MLGHPLCGGDAVAVRHHRHVPGPGSPRVTVGAGLLQAWPQSSHRHACKHVGSCSGNAGRLSPLRCTCPRRLPWWGDTSELPGPRTGAGPGPPSPNLAEAPGSLCLALRTDPRGSSSSLFRGFKSQLLVTSDLSNEDCPPRAHPIAPQ